MKIFGNNARFRKFCATTTGFAALTMGVAGSASHQAKAAYAPPSWQSNAVIYTVYPQIFSSNGLAGVDAALPRLKSLGITVLWMMPFQPLGTTATVDGQTKYPLTPPTPYCQSNLTGIDPAEGTSSDLAKLISDAHADGMHLIMDVAINQTAWSNPLITSNRSYYYINSSGDIENAFPNGANDSDIAGVDILNDNNGAQTYMKSVLQYWLNQGFDGFRFDSADSPYGSGRDLVQSYAQSLYSSLNPSNTLMWLEEGNNSSLALSPYTLDYNWSVTGVNGGGVLPNTAKNGSGVSQLEAAITNSTNGNGGFPTGFQHMDFLQDWDTDQDYNDCGGYPQVLDAAAFNLTMPGVPMVYNGEEVGNDQGADNLNHVAIDWNSPNASKFQSFYTTMIANRLAHPALQQGTLNFEPNQNSNASVATYDRTSGSDEVYVEINFSNSAISGTCTVPTGSGSWTDISPSVSPGGTSHTLPSTGNFSLAPYDYAIFKRGAVTTPATPANFTATAGNGRVTLSWTASSGATSYNVYRSTTSGSEGTTAYNAGITSTSFIDTSVTNGTKYYYKVAAVNSGGTSAQSGEQSATPTASAATGSLSGSVASIGSATTYNLTSLGTSDWAAWGDNGGYDHDTSGGNKISNIAASGGSVNSFTSSFLGFTWTNGTPDASATGETYGYYNQGGSGDGFQFTVPASTTSQTLVVYVGGYNSAGTLTATLSDGSAATFTNATQSSTGSYYAAYTLNFNAASANQTLTVKWLQNNSGTNITIYGAYLTGGTAAASAPATPANFTGTAGNAQATLTWTASSGATSYNIYRSTTSGGEGTTAYNAGITSTSFVDTGLANGTTYYYKVAAVSSAGTSAQSNEVSVKPAATGSLAGSVSAASGTVNLTSVGTTDWAAYGFNTSAYDHTSAAKISNVTAVGGSLNSFSETGLGFTWTNGTPDASETNEEKGFYNNGGSGDGFSFTVPASTTAQNLNIYVGGYASGGTLTATLSDGSAPVYTDSSQSNSGNSFYSNYLLTFKAASAGQTLTVKWTQNGAGTNITLYGAALH